MCVPSANCAFESAALSAHIWHSLFSVAVERLEFREVPFANFGPPDQSNCLGCKVGKPSTNISDHERTTIR